MQRNHCILRAAGSLLNCLQFLPAVSSWLCCILEWHRVKGRTLERPGRGCGQFRRLGGDESWALVCKFGVVWNCSALYPKTLATPLNFGATVLQLRTSRVVFFFQRWWLGTLCLYWTWWGYFHSPTPGSYMLHRSSPQSEAYVTSFILHFLQLQKLP